MRAWLKDMRGNRSQADVATQCKMSQQMYSLIETGEREPTVKIAKAIAKALDFNWTKFYEDEKNSS